MSAKQCPTVSTDRITDCWRQDSEGLGELLRKVFRKRGFDVLLVGVVRDQFQSTLMFLEAFRRLLVIPTAPHHGIPVEIPLLSPIHWLAAYSAYFDQFRHPQHRNLGKIAATKYTGLEDSWESQ